MLVLSLIIVTVGRLGYMIVTIETGLLLYEGVGKLYTEISTVSDRHGLLLLKRRWVRWRSE